MLSGVLKSPGAVAVNIEIMRAFVGDSVGAITTRSAACAETRPPDCGARYRMEGEL